MAPNTYLTLLAGLGIDIPVEVWNDTHGIEPEPQPQHPISREPQYFDENDTPVYTASQLDWNRPEDVGVHDFIVVEDDFHAHPFALNYHDEIYYRANHRPKHRYSRPYRIRWTFSHLIGLTGKLPQGVRQRLLNSVTGETLQGRNAHEWVRSCLKKWGHKELYLSVPYIVARLGGPKWRVSTKQTMAVYDDAIRLHTVFDALRKQGRLGRQRFPKMQYVLLKLLDRHGVVAPYRVPWARTCIKRRQLRDFLTRLDANKTPWVIPSEEVANRLVPIGSAKAGGTTTEAAQNAAASLATTCGRFSPATGTSCPNPAPSCPTETTTATAASTTTPTTSAGCLPGTNLSCTETSTAGIAASTP